MRGKRNLLLAVMILLAATLLLFTINGCDAPTNPNGCDAPTTDPDQGSTNPPSGGPMPFVYEVENTGADCRVATNFPSFNGLQTIPNLPDPFLMEDGARISNKSQWACRRAEISQQIQYWGTGTKPSPSDSIVSAIFSGGRLSVVVRVGSQSVTLTTNISYPSGGSGPYPALIQMDGAGVPANIFSSRGCAVMSFNSGTLAPFFPSYNEKFQQLFPGDPTAGSFIGWA